MNENLTKNKKNLKKKKICITKKKDVKTESFNYDHNPKHDGQGDVLSIACSF